MHRLYSILALASIISTIYAAPQNSGRIDPNMPFLTSTATWDVSAPGTTAAPSDPSWTSPPYSNPFTIYTTMTNSEGVITGMPAVWTSQPPIPTVTSVASGVNSVLSEQASWGSMVASLYPSTTSTTAVPTALLSNATSSASQTGSATSSAATSKQSQFTGGAQQIELKMTSAGLALMGAVFALL